MKASELKQKSFDSISKEIKALESVMVKAAEQGQLKVEITTISDAAKVYLQDNGFEVKIFLKTGEVGLDTNKHSIHWHK